MAAPLKVLSIDQPWATLSVLGVKTHETRSTPFTGDMRPAGVKGLPGYSVHRDTIIGIASTRRIDSDLVRPSGRINGRFRVVGDHLEVTDHHMKVTQLDLPLGALLGTVRVVDQVPIVGPTPADVTTPCVAVGRYPSSPTYRWRRRPTGGMAVTDISDQYPMGKYIPGWWAIELDQALQTTDCCPWCGSEGYAGVDDCPLCAGEGGCDPIPVTGSQGVWAWNGEVRT